MNFCLMYEMLAIWETLDCRRVHGKGRLDRLLISVILCGETEGSGTVLYH